MSKTNHSLNLTANDKISKVLRKVKNKFPQLDRAVRKSRVEMKLWQRSTGKAAQAMGKFGKRMKGVGRTATTHLSAPIAAIGAATIMTAAKFDKSMNKVEALTGAAGKPLIALREQAKLLGRTTQFSATQAADAMSFLGMAGWDTQKIMKGLPGVLDLAAASGIDLASAADITSNIMGAFKWEAEEAGKAADILARVTNSANTDMNQLAETMKTAGPVAQKFGFSLEDTATAAGLLGNVGIQGSAAGTALKNAFLGLSAPAGKASVILKKIGVATTDSQGNLRDFSAIMGDMGVAMEKLPTGDKMKVLKNVFGKIGIAGGAELLDQFKPDKDGISGFQKLTDKIKGANSAQETARIMNKGAAGQMVKLRSATEGLMIAIGESGLLESFSKFVEKLTGFVQKMSSGDKEMLKLGTIFAAIAAAVGPLLMAFGTLMTFIPAIVTGFGYLIAAVKIVGGIIAAVAGGVSLPFILIATAVAAAAVAIYKYFQPVQDFVDGLASSISNFAVGGVKSFFGFGDDTEAKAVKNNVQEKRTTNESSLMLDFKNVPKGTSMQSSGSFSGMNLDMGLAGGGF